MTRPILAATLFALLLAPLVVGAFLIAGRAFGIPVAVAACTMLVPFAAINAESPAGGAR